ncbi:MAG: sugar isomerase domain-containing protein [Planctomycetes bacterium]|nr:sugar isomerase domain-containing protein [Planctomycetota bacterium]MBI3407597.1 sugar isomerase domain-containing protein [Planctomycetota bacterium]
MSRLQCLLDNQRDALDRAAALCTEAIARDGLVHLFGCGHSRMLCEEMTPRQGCFVGWHTIVELGLTYHNAIVGPNGLRQSLHLEKTLGYAEQILRNFAFGPHDVMIVISTSGIREVIVEMAEGARKRALKVIGVVSAQHCEAAKPAHPSGKKLNDVVDVLLDNGAPVGDSILAIEGCKNKTGPFSTVGGAMLMNMLRCEVAQRLMDRGIEPVFLPSHQFAGSRSVEEQLEYFYAQYARSVGPLYSRQG